MYCLACLHITTLLVICQVHLVVFLFMYSSGSINQVGSLLTTFWIIPQ
nr:MAG TPA: hypothetical protein [Caudoviricetes sp.]